MVAECVRKDREEHLASRELVNVMERDHQRNLAAVGRDAAGTVAGRANARGQGRHSSAEGALSSLAVAGIELGCNSAEMDNGLEPGCNLADIGFGAVLGCTVAAVDSRLADLLDNHYLLHRNSLSLTSCLVSLLKFRMQNA